MTTPALRRRYQSAEIDRRPAEPRQLAGAYGNSGRDVVAAALSVQASTVDMRMDALISGADSRVSAGRAADPATFIPNRLSIEASIRE